MLRSMRLLSVFALAGLAACGPAEQSQEEGGEVPTSPPTSADTRPAGFAACSVCHAIEPGRNGVGPSLFGVGQRKAGTLAGYTFSPAMQKSGLVWDEATLDGYILAPQKAVPGTKMAYPGLKDDKKRAEISAWLMTLK